MPQLPHYPLPQHLHEDVETVAELIARPGGAGNAVHVIARALGRAYNAGHQDGQNQTRQLAWIVDRLGKELAAGAEEAPDGR